MPPAHKKTTTHGACVITSWDTCAFKTKPGKDEPIATYPSNDLNETC